MCVSVSLNPNFLIGIRSGKRLNWGKKSDIAWFMNWYIVKPGKCDHKIYYITFMQLFQLNALDEWKYRKIKSKFFIWCIKLNIEVLRPPPTVHFLYILTTLSRVLGEWVGLQLWVILALTRKIWYVSSGTLLNTSSNLVAKADLSNLFMYLLWENFKEILLRQFISRKLQAASLFLE